MKWDEMWEKVEEYFVHLKIGKVLFMICWTQDEFHLSRSVIVGACSASSNIFVIS